MYFFTVKHPIVPGTNSTTFWTNSKEKSSKVQKNWPFSACFFSAGFKSSFVVYYSPILTSILPPPFLGKHLPHHYPQTNPHLSKPLNKCWGMVWLYMSIEQEVLPVFFLFLLKRLCMSFAFFKSKIIKGFSAFNIVRWWPWRDLPFRTTFDTVSIVFFKFFPTQRTETWHVCLVLDDEFIFAIWLTDERLLALFLAWTIVRDP